MNDIKHVGILGMRWGRRKGSGSAGSAPKVSADHTKAGGLKKKRLSELSNEELKTLTNRLQLEKQYKDLTKQDLSFGQKFVGDVLQNAGKQLAGKYVANLGESVINTVSALLKKG